MHGKTKEKRGKERKNILCTLDMIDIPLSFGTGPSPRNRSSLAIERRRRKSSPFEASTRPARSPPQKYSPSNHHGVRCSHPPRPCPRTYRIEHGGRDLGGICQVPEWSTYSIFVFFTHPLRGSCSPTPAGQAARGTRKQPAGCLAVLDRIHTDHSPR